MYDVLLYQSWVSTIQTVVLIPDVYQLFKRLNRNDSITRTRRCTSLLASLRLKLILDPASCKPVFVALHTPHSPHSPHSKSTSSTSWNSTSTTLSGTNVRSTHRCTARRTPSYRLLSACLPRWCLYRHTSASRQCFAQMSRVSLSVIIPSCMMTSWNYFKRQCTSFNLRQPTLWCEKLPLGTAEHWPGAARLKICVRTLLFLLLYFSACRGWPLRDNERTPVLPLFFCASKLIHEGLKVCMHLRDFVRTWTGLFCWEFSRKKLAIMLEITRGIFFTEKCLKFLREFEQEISQKWMDIFFPSKFPGNYFIRKGFDPELLWVL